MIIKKIISSFSNLHKYHPILSLGPLDGRYQKQISPLKEYFSQYALIKYRIKVQVEWLKYLFQSRMVKNKKGTQFQTTLDDLQQLDTIINSFDVQGAKKVKQIESVTNHDVKAVQYYIKEKLQLIPNLRETKQYVHFCCTSEDINNLSYSLLLKDAKDEILIKNYEQLQNKMIMFCENYAQTAMLSKTHGQSATPTTLGKQIANFTYRLNRQYKDIKKIKFTGKLNGAVGNFNAHLFAYPEYDWAKISKQFIQQNLKLEFNPYTTQIQPHDTICSFYNNLSLSNTILIGMSRDIWQYISIGYFKQKVKKHEVGSSTMPHKVNPIDFQNCQGNLGLANGIMNHFSQKLPISRLQRDLSDSTVLRNQGLAFGYTIIAYKSLLKGLDKLEVNSEEISNDLDTHYEVITEAVQTVMRKYGWENPYELLKQLTRGKKFNKSNLEDLIKKLSAQGLDQKELGRIRQLSPKHYLGNSVQMARNIRKYL